MKDEDQFEVSSKESSFVRGAYMLLFVIINNIAGSLLYILVLFQFLYKLVTGHKSEAVLTFSGQLNHYIYQTGRFASYQSDEKPFPFATWPVAEYPVEEGGDGSKGSDPVAEPAPAPEAKKPAPKKPAATRKRAPAKPKAPKAAPKDVE